MERTEIPCVGGIVLDEAGRMLLVLRGREPGRGRWSVPGGRVEAGEDDPAATAREVLEETGLRVDVHEQAGTAERDAPGGGVFVIRDYRCTLADGVRPEDAVAGDDAADVGWFSAARLRELDCVPGLLDALLAWGVLPSLR